MASAIERIDFVVERLIKNCVRVFARLDFGQGFKGLQVDDADFIFAAIAGESAGQLVRDGKAMDAGSVGYLAGDGLFIEIDDDDFCAVADVQPPGVGIDGQVVPASVAADGDFFDKMVRAISGLEQSCEKGGEVFIVESEFGCGLRVKNVDEP